MQPYSLSYIQEQQNEIIHLCKNIPNRWNTKYDIYTSYKKELDRKVENILGNTTLGSLNRDFVENLENYISLKKIDIKLYKEVDAYIRLSPNDRALKAPELKEKLINFKNSLKSRTFIKLVYLSECPELIDLFYENFPHPPLSLFDANQQPKILLQREEQRNNIVSEFNNQQIDPKVTEDKIIYLQRHIRSKMRQENEIERIGKIFFSNSIDSDIKAKELIENANTPYTPQKCSPELSERIVKAANGLNLYTSVSHLLDPNNIAAILDGNLYGRDNLENLYIKFRPAALNREDIENGDGNVICFGPDKIDPVCLQDRTIGLELDLRLLLNEKDFNKNPTIFFKQSDLGYSLGRQFISFNDIEIFFVHSSGLNSNSKSTCFQIYDNKGKLSYQASIPNASMISYNVKEMDKILTLNFFRFLDSLVIVSDSKFDNEPAKDYIDSIYKKIENLNEKELKTFMLMLGRKISRSSEFNFFGAYKIDLNALRNIAIYEEQYQVGSINIEELCLHLNEGNFNMIDDLWNDVPKIFDSKRFLTFLTSNVFNPQALEKIASLASKNKLAD